MEGNINPKTVEEQIGKPLLIGLRQSTQEGNQVEAAHPELKSRPPGKVRGVDGDAVLEKLAGRLSLWEVGASHLW